MNIFGYDVPGWVIIAGAGGLAAIMLLPKQGGGTQETDTPTTLLSEELQKRLADQWEAWQKWAEDYMGKNPPDVIDPPGGHLIPPLPNEIDPGGDTGFPPPEGNGPPSGSGTGTVTLPPEIPPDQPLFFNVPYRPTVLLPPG